ncbi:unnamed protein product [Paramecium octaurelia]|uniref:Uncharacterized protein n=1 Tax=Paramecium octaurelia TaxID=43137 RepID=A0A8S1WKN4_PAROT|nr:unnamed protein product [Paramecium octaurelia]
MFPNSTSQVKTSSIQQVAKILLSRADYIIQFPKLTIIFNQQFNLSLIFVYLETPILDKHKYFNLAMNLIKEQLEKTRNLFTICLLALLGIYC